ncbi:aminomethyl transferase family protein [Citricoccus sp. NR2]|uniref:aminomethyl transferase family protein n=1 Tax=Citricoccus sp. NR2 TaxID=3004095 RepID=UPI0022DDE2FB|nr:aminomethyl transferase family protein [Citricoccus sp. NR2]WBL19274.1 aminomethyl transferase family protein [Citricoccus sp. NR2]
MTLTATATTTAAEAIATAGSAVDALRNAQAKPTVFPVQAEFTNWRSEQRAWREGVALLDQSHHMTDLFISGPDALRLLSDTGVNNFSRFRPQMAKQFIAVNHEGYLIGDAILVYLEEESFDLVGWHMVLDWVQFIGETGDYDVTFERDASSAVRQGDPTLYRYEVQGPDAEKLMQKVSTIEVAQTRFFGMLEFEIAGRRIPAIRHGMAGQPGFEMWGPWEDREVILQALVEAGAEFDLTRVGSLAYSTANLESAWVPSPPAAIFTGERMEEYLDWLPAARMGSIAGSLDSEDIEDYYLTPFDLGYGFVIDWDHDFIGREALRSHAKAASRKKVTLVWDPEELASAQRTLYEEGVPAKFINLPKARYGQFQTDRVLHDGRDVGISLDAGYLANEQAFVSLATIEEEFSAPGTEVTLVWGEDPASTKPAVEAHRQIQIRATVQPAPYSRFTRENYRRNS